jgi:NitT/TauT family transport system ATP-binding protein
MVTHNIEEAVLMCNRIIVLSSNPGRIAAEIHVTMQHPRNRLDPEFRQMVDKIYALMTRRPEPAPPGRDGAFSGLGLGMSLPEVSTNLLAGLLETIAGPPYKGRADMPALAEDFHMEIDDLFPVAETLQLLRFAEIEEGDIKLTPAGQRFAISDVDVRKKLFGDHLLAYVPLAARIKMVLDERPAHWARSTRFLEELEDYMSEDYADRTLRAIISWGRYGEIFAYDEVSETFSLENPQ